MQKERVIMSKITLVSMTCLDSQEGGGDEIYFKFKDNGSNSSSNSSVFKGMDTGDSRTLGTSFSFSGSVKVTMYEEDTFSDDYVQSVTLYDPGHHSVTLSEPGMTYVLNYFIA